MQASMDPKCPSEVCWQHTAEFTGTKIKDNFWPPYKCTTRYSLKSLNRGVTKNALLPCTETQQHA